MQSSPLTRDQLGQMLDVAINSLGNGEIIVSSSGIWINQTLAEAGIAAAADVVKKDGTVALTGNWSAGGNKITSLGTPTSSGDAAPKGYVDALIQGLDVKNSVRVATTTAGTLATDFENGDTVDGVTLATLDRILIKNQSTASENGIYVVAASGAPTRATDFAAGATVAGAYCLVDEGSNEHKGFVCTNNAGSDVVGTDNLSFTQFNAAGAVSTLDDLSDVIITTPASGHFVRYNGSNWINVALVEADLPVMVGDSGAGGTKGAVPAPAAGDATKFLRGDGTFADPPGGGSGSSHWHDPVECVTTANVDLAGGGIANGTTHDGVTVSTGQRILVRAQSSNTENGIYVVPASGAASRASDMTTSHVASADQVNVKAGSYADYSAIVTSNSSVVGTDPITWGMVDNGLTAITANYVMAGPVSGSAAVPTYRAIVVKDLPLAPYQAHNLAVNSGFWFGSMRKDPSNPASISDDNYGLDCWNVLSQGGTALVSRIAGTNEQYAIRVQNNTGSSNRLALNQIIEAAETYPVRGQQMTFLCRVRCSQTKNLRISILSVTGGTDDVVTSDIIGTWTSTTYTSLGSGNFFINPDPVDPFSTSEILTAQVACTANTWRTAVVSGTIAATARNLVIAVSCDDALSDGEKFDMEGVDFYLGTEVTTARPRRPFVEEQLRAARFAFVPIVPQEYVPGFKANASQIYTQMFDFPVEMRADPTGVVTTTPTFNNGAASASQIASYNRVAAGYTTITGALTVTAQSYSPKRGFLYLGAGTSFSGTVGDIQSIDFGSDFHAYFHAFL